MGRTGKATSSTIKVQPETTDTKECVSVDAISELMKDFTCASLLTKSNQRSTKGKGSSVKEAHANCCEEIVSSLKHFHLKTPVNKRTRLKEKKNLERRSKSVLENKYNLSVAAIHSQTSIVWPGKLNGLSNKRNDSSVSVILRPSRLSIPGVGDNVCSKSSLSSPIHTSSSEEKARIAASLCGQNVPPFGDLNGKKGYHTLSFSKLCNKNSKLSIPGVSIPNPCPLPASVKTQGYRNRLCSTVSKHRHNASTSTDDNQSCHPSGDSGLFHKSIVQSSSRQQQQISARGHFSNSASSLEIEPSVVSNNNNDSFPSAYSQSPFLPTSSPSSNPISNNAGHATCEKSCSEEMRMEESNVNELASYFEDLLHIPRKMSVMAEMMYA